MEGGWLLPAKPSAGSGAGLLLQDAFPLRGNNNEEQLLVVIVKVRTKSLQEQADGFPCSVYASRQVKRSVPALAMTYSARHQARRPGPIGGWTVVTSVAAAHPPFAFLWSAVKECFIGAPTECCCCTIKGACQEAAHMSPATQRILRGSLLAPEGSSQHI